MPSTTLILEPNNKSKVFVYLKTQRRRSHILSTLKSVFVNLSRIKWTLDPTVRIKLPLCNSIVTWRDFNCDLTRVSQCLEDNYLIINDTKTQAIIVGKSNYNYEFTLKSSNILTVDELKLLRVTINNKLTFSSHIKLVLSKIHAKIAALRRIRSFIGSDTAIKLYKSYILPHFGYCIPLLMGMNQTLSDELENAK